MKKDPVKVLRVTAIILLVLILLVFGFMVYALIRAEYGLFSIAGGVLVALLVCGFVIRYLRVKREEALKDAEEEQKTE
jgi:small neutral amino acid transporter SnatA (MarC family)